MNSIPEMCMIYTEVFKTMRLEIGLAFLAGILFATLLTYWRDK